MHAHNVFHRDVKLTNVLVGDGGSPVLCDFGVSKMHAGQTVAVGPSAMTTAAQSSLTPAYAAPEVIRQDAHHAKGGEKADVFGFGVCLWVATYGNLPERDTSTHCISASSKAKLLAGGGNVHGLLQKVLSDEPSDRPSADQALLHRYFSDTHEVSLKVPYLYCALLYILLIILHNRVSSHASTGGSAARPIGLP